MPLHAEQRRNPRDILQALSRLADQLAEGAPEAHPIAVRLANLYDQLESVEGDLLALGREERV
jgi:hypothetical protein